MSKNIISEKEVHRIAHLARLGLTEEEASRATKDLSGVLDHFSVMQEIDTKDVPMAADASGLKNITRIDEAAPNALCDASALLDAAPDKHDGHIKVRAIFE